MKTRSDNYSLTTKIESDTHYEWGEPEGLVCVKAQLLFEYDGRHFSAYGEGHTVTEAQQLAIEKVLQLAGIQPDKSRKVRRGVRK